MAICVQFQPLETQSGTVQILVEGNTSPCTSALLLTPAEYGAFAASPFHLSVEDGMQIGWLIAAVWATAWGFRILSTLFFSRERETE